MTKVLIFAGSARRGAYSRQLAAAATMLVESHGGTPTLIDLGDFLTPLYNPDLEAELGIPQQVMEFRRLVATHDGLVVVTLGYNGFEPLLLNMLRWASRPLPGVISSMSSRDRRWRWRLRARGALAGCG